MVKAACFVLLWSLALASAVVKIKDTTALAKLDEYLFFTVRTQNDLTLSSPFITVEEQSEVQGKYELRFTNSADFVNNTLKIFEVVDEGAAINFYNENVQINLFEDLAYNVPECRTYFTNCETAPLKNQVFREKVDGTFMEKKYLLASFTNRNQIPANFVREFELSYSYLIETYEYYFNTIYMVLILLIIHNVYSILKYW